MKVYCKKCKYYSWFTEGCWKFKENVDTAFKNYIETGDCFILNKKNDCKKYSAKTWKDKFKNIFRLFE